MSRYAKHRLKFAGLLAIALLASACSKAPIATEDSWVRPLLPGRDITAGYVTITNNTPRSLVLTGARSDNARAIEIHESITRGDNVGMRRHEQISIASGTSTHFAPGGLHLMIFGVAQMPEPFMIELIFAEAPTLPVSFSTQPP